MNIHFYAKDYIHYFKNAIYLLLMGVTGGLGYSFLFCIWHYSVFSLAVY